MSRISGGRRGNGLNLRILISLERSMMVILGSSTVSGSGLVTSWAGVVDIAASAMAAGSRGEGRRDSHMMINWPSKCQCRDGTFTRRIRRVTGKRSLLYVQCLYRDWAMKEDVQSLKLYCERQERMSACSSNIGTTRHRKRNRKEFNLITECPLCYGTMNGPSEMLKRTGKPKVNVSNAQMFAQH